MAAPTSRGYSVRAAQDIAQYEALVTRALERVQALRPQVAGGTVNAVMAYDTHQALIAMVRGVDEIMTGPRAGKVNASMAARYDGLPGGYDFASDWVTLKTAAVAIAEALRAQATDPLSGRVSTVDVDQATGLTSPRQIVVTGELQNLFLPKLDGFLQAVN